MLKFRKLTTSLIFILALLVVTACGANESEIIPEPELIEEIEEVIEIEEPEDLPEIYPEEVVVIFNNFANPYFGTSRNNASIAVGDVFSAIDAIITGDGSCAFVILEFSSEREQRAAKLHSPDTNFEFIELGTFMALVWVRESESLLDESVEKAISAVNYINENFIIVQ